MNMFEEKYTEKALNAAEELLDSINGAIRNGRDAGDSLQLRIQLSRWLKKNRGESVK